MFSDRSVRFGFAGIGLALALYFFSLLLAGATFWKSQTALEVVTSPEFRASLWLSMWAATVATGLALLIGLPTAYWLSRARFRGHELIDTLLDLPTTLSPIATGTLLLMLFHTSIGSWFQSNVTYVVYTTIGIVLAQFTIVVSLAVRLLKSSFDGIPKRYEDMARLLGCNPWKTFCWVSLPLARPGIIAAIILCWARAFGEFGATVTLAGAMPNRTETIPTGISLRLDTVDLSGTVVLIALLVSISMLFLFILRSLTKKGNHTL